MDRINASEKRLIRIQKHDTLNENPLCESYRFSLAHVSETSRNAKGTIKANPK